MKVQLMQQQPVTSLQTNFATFSDLGLMSIIQLLLLQLPLDGLVVFIYIYNKKEDVHQYKFQVFWVCQLSSLLADYVVFSKSSFGGILYQFQVPISWASRTLQVPIRSPKKQSCFQNDCVKFYLSLTHLNSRMCIRIYVFCLKKDTQTKSENAKEEKRISVENLIGIDFLQICFVYF